MRRTTPTNDGDSRATAQASWGFGNLLRDRTILVLVVMFLAGMAGLLWQISRLQSVLVNTIAIQNASLYSDALTQFRILYTSEVVKRAKSYGMEITHDYETKEGAIPLPATLSMMLGNRIAKSNSGGTTKLYSDYPFPWRRETGGLTDDFAREAWKHLRQQPETPYYRFENYLGVPSLRYATADLMRASCINCHNTHPETPKNDWELGDVRGVLEVSIPLDVAITETRSGLRGTFAMMVGMAFLGITALVIVIGRLRQSTVELEQRVSRRTASLGESEARIRAFVDSAADGIITIDERGIIETFNAAAERIFGYGSDEIVGRNINLLMPSTERKAHDGYLETYLKTGVKTIIGSTREVTAKRKDETTFPLDLNVSELQIGERRLFTGIIRDITKRKKAESGLKRFRLALDASADAIFLIDRETMQFVDASKSACASLGYSYDELLTMGPHDIKPEFTKEQLAAKFDEVIDKKVTVSMVETAHRRKDGTDFPVEVMIRSTLADGRPIMVAAVRDITERKWAEQQLEELHKKVVDASRQAGMAEIATGVLHNVGNVLNSVNVSATLVSDKIRKSKVSSLTKATGLMREHAHDLGAFITEDEKGKKLPAYLDKLAEHLAAEQNSMMGELGELTKNIEHIKKIVSTQQSHAGAFGVVETVSIAEVIDDALTVNATSFERYGIEMIREYTDLRPISLDKQKLLQIMVNLVRNAKHAVLDCECEHKQLTLRIASHGKTEVRIEVVDNGMGIAAENLTKIFSHGFTTKEDGHGFGLHSAALAAKEMGGSLSVHSDGPGTGATFTLDLPLRLTETEEKA